MTMVKPDTEWLENAKDSANEIKKDIEKLREQHINDKAFDFNEFKEDAKQVSYKFKNLILTKADRDKLWQEYNNLWETAKNKNKEQWDKVKSFSRDLRNAIISKINDIKNAARKANSKKELEEVQTQLDEAFEWFKKGFKNCEPFKDYYKNANGDNRLLQSDHQKCWKTLQSTKDYVNRRRGNLFDKNFREYSKKAENILKSSKKGDPYYSLDEIKKLQDELKKVWMSWKQKDIIRKKLNNAWDNASGRIENKKEERKRKYEQWKRRMRKKVGQLRNEMKKNNEKIDSIKDEIADIQQEIDESTSQSFKERARGKILIKEAEIRQIRRESQKIKDELKEIEKDV